MYNTVIIIYFGRKPNIFQLYFQKNLHPLPNNMFHKIIEKIKFFGLKYKFHDILECIFSHVTLMLIRLIASSAEYVSLSHQNNLSNMHAYEC